MSTDGDDDRTCRLRRRLHDGHKVSILADGALGGQRWRGGKLDDVRMYSDDVDSLAWVRPRGLAGVRGGRVWTRAGAGSVARRPAVLRLTWCWASQSEGRSENIISLSFTIEWLYPLTYNYAVWNNSIYYSDNKRSLKSI